MSAVFRTIDDGENAVGIIKFNVPLFICTAQKKL